MDTAIWNMPMNAKRDYALVPRPFRDIARVAPNVTRVLSGMVADVLVVARQQVAKPIFSVLIGHGGVGARLYEVLLNRKLGERFDVKYCRFGDETGFNYDRASEELLQFVKYTHFDLIVAHCWFCPSQRPVFALVKQRYGIPIMVATSYFSQPDLDALLQDNTKPREVDALLAIPFSPPQFFEALDVCLRTSQQSKQ